MPQVNVFDPQVLEGLRRFGGGGFVDQMVELFLHSTKSVVADTRALVDAEDWKGVAFAAHSLRSGSGNLGLTGLMDCVGAMEAAARIGDGERIRQIVEALPALYEDSCATLKKYVAKP
jgi:HPt (histidine-containing phosphotransfer) domain-containing protein